MSSRTSPQTALLLAGAGAAAVLGSLWLPWYTIRFPDSFKDALGQLGGAGSPAGSSSAPADQIAAGFGAMMKGLVAAIPTEITGDGWQTLGGADWALAILAGIALIAVLAVGGGLRSVRADAGATGRVIAGIGGICAAIALYHLVKKPGTGLSGGALGGFDDIITVRYGLYLAIAGGLLMVAGGLLAGRSGAPAAVPAEAVVPEAPAYTPPAPYAPPGAPHAAPVAADPFAAPAPVTAYAADPFAAPAPAVHATEPYAAPEPYAPGPAAAPPASPVLPAVPREPGTSVAPPGWAPPGA